MYNICGGLINVHDADTLYLHWEWEGLGRGSHRRLEAIRSDNFYNLRIVQIHKNIYIRISIGFRLSKYRIFYVDFRCVFDVGIFKCFFFHLFVSPCKRIDSMFLVWLSVLYFNLVGCCLPFFFSVFCSSLSLNAEKCAYRLLSIRFVTLLQKLLRMFSYRRSVSNKYKQLLYSIVSYSSLSYFAAFRPAFMLDAFRRLGMVWNGVEASRSRSRSLFPWLSPFPVFGPPALRCCEWSHRQK